MTSISAWIADGTRKGLGLGDDQVLIVDRYSAWGNAFEELCPLFQAALLDSRIEHMGSTAIDGCPAKPILDVSVSLTPLISLDADVANDLHLICRSVNPESTLFAIYGSEHLRLANVHVR